MIETARLQTLLAADVIESRVRELAARIERDYQGVPLTVLAVLKGSVFFLVDLIRQVKIPLRLEFVRASSYGAGTTSCGTVTVGDFDVSFANRHVLVVDDILDSGRTLKAICDQVRASGPTSVKTCVLIDKRKPRAVEFEADYQAFEIPDVFIVGYGLDYDEQFRNLPYIASVIDPPGESEARAPR